MVDDETIASLLRLADDVGPVLHEWVGGGMLDLLPQRHVELLSCANGMTVQEGAFRIFGVRPERHLDLVQWNDAETWKFAWNRRRAEDFFCFGETAWGDQYAYHLAEGSARFDPEVYMLDGIALIDRVLAPNFDEFLHDIFLRNAIRPYSSETIEALQRFGCIASSLHWVYTPSLALDGPESIGNVVQLPAITAMIIAGDIDSSLWSAPEDAFVTGVEPWCDSRGRDRLRVLYSR